MIDESSCHCFVFFYICKVGEKRRYKMRQSQISKSIIMKVNNANMSKIYRERLVEGLGRSVGYDAEAKKILCGEEMGLYSNECIQE